LHYIPKSPTFLLQSKHLFLSFCSLFTGYRLNYYIESSTYFSAMLTGVEVYAGDLATNSSFLVSFVFLHRKHNTCSRRSRGLRRTQIRRIGSIHCIDCLTSLSNGLAIRSLIILTRKNSYIIKHMSNNQIYNRLSFIYRFIAQSTIQNQKWKAKSNDEKMSVY
jgi:ribosomal protein S26